MASLSNSISAEDMFFNAQEEFTQQTNNLPTPTQQTSNTSVFDEISDVGSVQTAEEENNIDSELSHSIESYLPCHQPQLVSGFERKPNDFQLSIVKRPFSESLLDLNVLEEQAVQVFTREALRVFKTDWIEIQRPMAAYKRIQLSPIPKEEIISKQQLKILEDGVPIPPYSSNVLGKCNTNYEWVPNEAILCGKSGADLNFTVQRYVKLFFFKNKFNLKKHLRCLIHHLKFYKPTM